MSRSVDSEALAAINHKLDVLLTQGNTTHSLTKVSSGKDLAALNEVNMELEKG